MRLESPPVTTPRKSCRAKKRVVALSEDEADEISRRKTRPSRTPMNSTTQRNFGMFSGVLLGTVSGPEICHSSSAGNNTRQPSISALDATLTGHHQTSKQNGPAGLEGDTARDKASPKRPIRAHFQKTVGFEQEEKSGIPFSNSRASTSEDAEQPTSIVEDQEGITAISGGTDTASSDTTSDEGEKMIEPTNSPPAGTANAVASEKNVHAAQRDKPDCVPATLLDCYLKEEKAQDDDEMALETASKNVEGSNAKIRALQAQIEAEKAELEKQEIKKTEAMGRMGVRGKRLREMESEGGFQLGMQVMQERYKRSRNAVNE
ncbi:hypothetical protein P154DRAFT_540645 [Amniculicola lignicola CBS 123094]|uniref:Uncharacterized protein n=1 Tax=Amniculicola lignicola CBS 123094 TaxID=1392246 RepID=A0A6A5VWU0_9PLEO|nr:hypothetical protein P154DRAFT_540645 [Amniculicola lignicola CBS 123094]